jgi:hypothetical protein
MLFLSINNEPTQQPKKRVRDMLRKCMRKKRETITVLSFLSPNLHRQMAREETKLPDVSTQSFYRLRRYFLQRFIYSA